jgi:CRISPR type I-E-associated protein CasB/Cse2
MPEILKQPSTGSSADTPRQEQRVFSFQDACRFEWKLSQLSRGRLAQLRRNAGQPLPGRGVAWFYGLLDLSDDRQYRAQPDEVCFVVATLYDLNRFQTSEKNRRFGSLGKSLSLVRRKIIAASSSREPEEAAKSLDRRFQILLDAEFDDGATSELAFRLRQTVQFLKGQGVGFDPAHLICDLLDWSHPSRKAQKRWARHYFNAPAELSEFAPETTQDLN